jgi:phage tail sheath protein FI
MPQVINTPGIYIEEQIQVQPISPAEAALTAFVGSTRKGPVGKPTLISDYSSFEHIFGGLAAEHMLAYAVQDYFTNGGRQVLILRLAGSGASRAQINLPTAVNPQNTLKLEAASEGVWGNDLSVQVMLWDGSPKGIKRWLKRASAAPRFRLHVFERGQLSEVFSEVSLTPGDAVFLPDVLSSQSRLIRAVKPGPSYVLPTAMPLVNPSAIQATGGQDGSALAASDYLKNEADGQGIYALKQADGFNLLCIPPAQKNGHTEPSVYRAALELCMDHRAILLIDPPANWSGSTQHPASELLGIQGPETCNAAVYFPRLVQQDVLQHGRDECFVACGAAAGVIAATDAKFGVWKPPAGSAALLKVVKQLQPVLTTSSLESLSIRGVNVIRNLPDNSFALWGARTLFAEGAYTYLSVRRTALFIEDSVSKGIRWALFEANDELLWGKVRQQVERFMWDLFLAGAFPGNRPEVAYFVKCDRETTTHQDLTRGYFNLLIGFAPLRPAEFIVLSLRQKAGAV